MITIMIGVLGSRSADVRLPQPGPRLLRARLRMAVVYCTLLYSIVLHCGMVCVCIYIYIYIIVYHVIQWYIITCYITVYVYYNIILYHIILHYIILCYIVSYYIILYNIIILYYSPELARGAGRTEGVRSIRKGANEWGQHQWGRCEFNAFRQRDFFGTPVNLLLSPPQVPGRTFFPNLSNLITSAAAPWVLTPFVRNQQVQSFISNSKHNPMKDARACKDDHDRVSLPRRRNGRELAFSSCDRKWQ